MKAGDIKITQYQNISVFIVLVVYCLISKDKNIEAMPRLVAKTFLSVYRDCVG